MMGGRVKTLVPQIHGGILSRRKEDRDETKKHGIKEIDLVVVNLYPFEETIKKPNIGLDEPIENIDIGDSICCDGICLTAVSLSTRPGS